MDFVSGRCFFVDGSTSFSYPPHPRKLTENFLKIDGTGRWFISLKRKKWNSFFVQGRKLWKVLRTPSPHHHILPPRVWLSGSPPVENRGLRWLDLGDIEALPQGPESHDGFPWDGPFGIFTDMNLVDFYGKLVGTVNVHGLPCIYGNQGFCVFCVCFL